MMMSFNQEEELKFQPKGDTMVSISSGVSFKANPEDLPKSDAEAPELQPDQKC